VLRDLHMPCPFSVLDPLIMLWLGRSVAYNHNLVGTLPASWSALTRLGTLCAPPPLLPVPLYVSANLCGPVP
jgi:hypothetical protein